MASVNIDEGALRAFTEELVQAYADTESQAIVAALDAEAPPTADGTPRRHSADRPVRTATGWVIKFRVSPRGGVSVHEGHPEIRPKRARRLRFVNAHGEVVYAKSIPATVGNPWLVRGLRRAGFQNVRHVRH